MFTPKEDLAWTHDWDNPFVFSEALDKCIVVYSTDYPHQALNKMTLKQYYKTFKKQHSQSQPNSSLFK